MNLFKSPFRRIKTWVLAVSAAGYFISPTWILAQEAPAEAPTSQPMLDTLPALLIMFAIFFFLIIWPQQRKAKKQAQFLAALQKGDDVVTQSGIFGKIVGIADRVITLEIAPQVKIRVDRSSISAKDTGTTSEQPKAAQS